MDSLVSQKWGKPRDPTTLFQNSTVSSGCLAIVELLGLSVALKVEQVACIEPQHGVQS